MEIKRRSDLSEMFFYTVPDFPMLLEDGRISEYPNYTALSHWHDDIELGLVLSGQMEYTVNGRGFLLGPGEGIFVNSRQMHGNRSPRREECLYICLVAHPSLLCASAYAEQNYVAPLLENPRLPYLPLRPQVPWENRVCQQIREMALSRRHPAWALAAQAGLLNIWRELYENAPIPKEPVQPRSQRLNAMKTMMAYIQKHYREKITLTDIARAGNMSKTSCCSIFHKYVNQTPNAYLIEYRLRSGLELLRTTDMTVTEICYEVGFGGPSYFSESFRKTFGCSPGEYRRQSEARAAGEKDGQDPEDPEKCERLL